MAWWLLKVGGHKHRTAGDEMERYLEAGDREADELVVE
jgi:hypothetical protein